MELTLQQLKDMKPDTSFATGTGTFSEITPQEIRWVAVRRGIYDWCIYALFSHESIEKVRREGDKIRNESIIKRLVPCTNEAYGMYAF